jgi:hypothetical protein
MFILVQHAAEAVTSMDGQDGLALLPLVFAKAPQGRQTGAASSTGPPQLAQSPVRHEKTTPIGNDQHKHSPRDDSQTRCVTTRQATDALQRGMSGNVIMSFRRHAAVG